MLQKKKKKKEKSWRSFSVKTKEKHDVGGWNQWVIGAMD